MTTEEGSQSWSDSSSDASGIEISIECLLKGARRKSHSDQRFWPSRQHHKLKKSFMQFPKDLHGRIAKVQQVQASNLNLMLKCKSSVMTRHTQLGAALANTDEESKMAAQILKKKINL